MHARPLSLLEWAMRVWLHAIPRGVHLGGQPRARRRGPCSDGAGADVVDVVAVVVVAATVVAVVVDRRSRSFAESLARGC